MAKSTSGQYSIVNLIMDLYEFIKFRNALES